MGEQKRIGMIPGLENAEFVRYGVMHLTYINSPDLLNHAFQLKEPRLSLCWSNDRCRRLLESAASGLMVGLQVYRY